MLIHMTKQNVEVFVTLESFVESVTITFSPTVELENIQNVFLFFGGFLMLVLLVFILDIFLLNQLKIIARKLARGSLIFVQTIKLRGWLFLKELVQRKPDNSLQDHCHQQNCNEIKTD